LVLLAQVREQLRMQMRERGQDARASRMHLRSLLFCYRISMRKERMYYWKKRSEAADNPGIACSFVTDGASSKSVYVYYYFVKCPHSCVNPPPSAVVIMVWGTWPALNLDTTILT